MEVITIESRAFKLLVEKLDALTEYVYSMERPVENELGRESGNLPVSEDQRTNITTTASKR